MMLQQMRHINFQNKSVFDFGTGTGILAILAEKLGALKITAIDVDDWSIENAGENFERNGCHRITVSLSSNLPNETFDVVLANINRNVIIQYLAALMKIIGPNGLVLFSGLMVDDESAMLEQALMKGLQLQNKAERHGWISLLFVNQR
jgi:ribosomal protein L11 methyltransferase